MVGELRQTEVVPGSFSNERGVTRRAGAAIGILNKILNKTGKKLKKY
jgi:hypothetical protein